jgi:hypothetical protein
MCCSNIVIAIQSTWKVNLTPVQVRIILLLEMIVTGIELLLSIAIALPTGGYKNEVWFFLPIFQDGDPVPNFQQVKQLSSGGDIVKNKNCLRTLGL